MKACVSFWQSVRMMVSAVLIMFSFVSGNAYALPGGTCFGKFPNPITDVCWSCMLPISIGASPVAVMRQDDRVNPPNPICYCPIPLPPFIRVGIEIGFWEPARLVEAVRTPFCFPGLGGRMIGSNALAIDGAQDPRSALGGATTSSFYQAHQYINPILYILDVMSGWSCLEQAPFDIGYITEYDPSWHDDELSAILSPEETLFASLPAALICIGDCVAATAAMPFDPLIWCVGCSGPMFPITGVAQAHIGGIQASHLIVTRLQYKLHREFVAWQYWDLVATCGPIPAPQITKSAYKISLVYPFNQNMLLGQCCSPFGRSVEVFAFGMEYPIMGEDFVYQMFRKRNCCAF